MQEIIDWYNAIRAAKFHYFQIAFPSISPEQILPNLTRDFIHEGWLWKTGPKVGDSYKKRWFILDSRKLMYLEDPLVSLIVNLYNLLIVIVAQQDPYPKGEVRLGEKGRNYAISSGIPPPLKQHMFGFLLKTPERTWLFSAETEEERKQWISAILTVLDRPETPHDSGVYLRHSRGSISSIRSRESTSSNRNSGSSFGGTLRKGKNFFHFN